MSSSISLIVEERLPRMISSTTGFTAISRLSDCPRFQLRITANRRDVGVKNTDRFFLALSCQERGAKARVQQALS